LRETHLLRCTLCSFCGAIDPCRDYVVCLQYTPNEQQSDENSVTVSLVPLPYDQSVILGRGRLLGIDDKKVSRQQAVVVAQRVSTTTTDSQHQWTEPTLRLTPVSVLSFLTQHTCNMT
jgi:hypothetical protein